MTNKQTKTDPDPRSLAALTVSAICVVWLFILFFSTFEEGLGL